MLLYFSRKLRQTIDQYHLDFLFLPCVVASVLCREAFVLKASLDSAVKFWFCKCQVLFQLKDITMTIAEMP